MKRSQNVLKFKRREFYRNDDIYYQKMKEIEMFKGFFTINDLAKTTKRSTRHSRRIIIKFRKSKRIRIFEPHRSSRLNPHITKYVVS